MHISHKTPSLTSSGVESRVSLRPVPLSSQEEEPIMAMDTHPVGKAYLLPLLF